MWIAGPATAVTQECPDYNPQRNPYFGDLHVHTAFSFDAVLLGVQAGPNAAYAFAKGAPIPLAPLGRPILGSAAVTQLERPLDFTAVTDHAEFFGEFNLCTTPPADPTDPAAPYNTQFCIDYRAVVEGNRSLLTPTPPEAVSRRVFRDFTLPLVAPIPQHHPFCGPNGDACRAAAVPIWEETQDAARLANDPCTFSAFNAYEWTKVEADPSLTAGTAILHRNVIFRGDSVPSAPITVFEAPKVELLWAGLQQECLDADPDCDVLAIPHSMNQSAGRAFKPVYTAEPLPSFPFWAERPLTTEDAETRAAFEPVVEVIQHKAASECRISMLSEGGVPFLGSDELCDFESSDANGNRAPTIPNQPLPRLSYVREGLKEGLVQEEALGANPFKVGMLGSTDTHNATSGQTSERDFARLGHTGINDGILPRVAVTSIARQRNAGGLAVVWAEENTRESIFDAIARKEVYGTSGGRPIVRFFGSWNVGLGICESQNTIDIADRNGVPMGADLPSRPGGLNGEKKPRFVVSAQQDPESAALQRIQIVKGWLDENGEAQEAVYDVAGDPYNGASVDVDTCEPQGAGFGSLCSVWEDPDFDPNQRAFYYSRTVENPTCRWNQQFCADTFGNVGQACAAGVPQANGLDWCCDSTAGSRQWCDNALAAAAQQGLECDEGELDADLEASCCAENYVEAPTTVQERAWSSPIWYTP
jgi:hypothetical protein